MNMRLILGSQPKVIESQFNNILSHAFCKNFNGAPGTLFPAAVSFYKYSNFVNMIWGLDKAGEKIYTVPSKGIVSNWTYRASIKMSRCLIPCNAISVKIKNERFLLFSRQSKLFALAGIYFLYENQYHFALLSRQANFFFSELGLKEEPIFLTQNDYLKWFRNDFSSLLTSNNEDYMKLEGFQVSSEMDDISLNSKELIKPVSLTFSEQERLRQVKEKMILDKGKRNKTPGTAGHWGDLARKQFDEDKNKH